MAAGAMHTARQRIEAAAGPDPRSGEILTGLALDFVQALCAQFGSRRRELLGERPSWWRSGQQPDFLASTRHIRDDEHWQVTAPAPGLTDRRVEITGPPEPKMAINALNSGAKVWMADFEDATSPTWRNIVAGQLALKDAVRRTLSYTSPDGRHYSLGGQLATLVVRPRGWHLDERHITVDGEPVPAALADFGLFFFHNARELIATGHGPYFYLPKLEHHTEARLWNDVFCFAEDYLGLSRSAIRATVLIETISAAFEMEEILYELREHSAGLNAGRWDYIFSVIKNLGSGPEFVLPDRSAVTMTVPFMRAYTELLVATCHKRGAHAIGGMSALIPGGDPAANEAAFARVAEDKRREAGDGFDGSWVAHPGLVAVCRAEFDAVLGGKPNQLDRLRADVSVTAGDLLSVRLTPGQVTDAGVRANVSVVTRYLAAWLGGTGAVALSGLMEDAATAEISRSQLWQWISHRTPLAGGGVVTRGYVAGLLEQELAAYAAQAGSSALIDAVRELVAGTALGQTLPAFLTLPAYDQLLAR